MKKDQTDNLDDERELEIPTMVFELHEELIPEQRFMLAMLVRAIRDLGGTLPEEQSSAWHWVTGEVQGELSFEDVCSGLNYDTYELRSQLMSYFAHSEVH